MFVACSPGSSRCLLPQYHKRLPPIGHAAPRAHVKAGALPGWKWIGATFGVKKQLLWKKAVHFASTHASGLLQTAVWSLLTVWFASWLRPRMIMTATASAAGGRLRQGSKFVPQRPREEDAIKGYINTEMSGSQPMGTAFLVVTGSQGIGKSSMLTKAFSKLWKRGWWRGRWILPMEADLKPGESLQLSTLLATVLRQPDKDKPSQEIWLLTTLNELCKACTRGPVVVYLQLTTKNRADQFSYDECDAIASAVGAFARRLTYDVPLCKFIVEVSVSLIADKIKEKFNMSRLLVVQPLPFAEFVKVMKTDKMLSGRLEQVVGKDAGQIEEVLKYYYLRAGGNFRDLAELLENVAVAGLKGLKGAEEVKIQIQRWYDIKTKPLLDCLAIQSGNNQQSKFQGFLESVAKAGPVGYICKNATEGDLEWELGCEKPAAGIIRRTTSTSITLKHWHFTFKILGESEQNMKDFGYM